MTSEHQRPARIGAVLLAAGSSRRAGPINKLLHPIEGEAMIHRIARVVLTAGLTPCIVVLGNEAARVEAALADLAGPDLRFVVNEAHSEGMGRSIAVGIDALTTEPELDGAAIVLGDMPYLRVEDLVALCAAFRSLTPAPIVAPEAGEGDARRLGNPVLWPRPYFDRLAALNGDRGARQLLMASPQAVLPIPILHDGVLRDIDCLPEETNDPAPQRE